MFFNCTTHVAINIVKKSLNIYLLLLDCAERLFTFVRNVIRFLGSDRIGHARRLRKAWRWQRLSSSSPGQPGFPRWASSEAAVRTRFQSWKILVHRSPSAIAQVSTSLIGGAASQDRNARDRPLPGAAGTSTAASRLLGNVRRSLLPSETTSWGCFFLRDVNI